MRLQVPHAVARLSAWNGPMKPPLEGGAIPSGQMRSLVSPWPSSGAAAPQSAHASRIIAVAWCSATQNGMPCSDAIRWYCRSRAICGSTRDLEPAAADGAEGSAFRLGNFCSITRRHLLHCSAPTPPSAAAGASYMLGLRARSAVPSSVHRAADAYARANTERPLLTRAVTTAVLAAIGDLLAQSVASAPRAESSAGPSSSSSGGGGCDLRRTAVMAGWGGVCAGPFNHFWYNWLERAVVLRNPMHAVGLKIALDHVAYAPVLVGFFAWTDLLQGRAATPHDALRQAVCSEHLAPTLRANVVAWTAVHALTFTVVPPPYHVLWVSVNSVFWSAYCSSVSEGGSI
mmetsp:Transcript_31747/g.105093  ORF Transcript_31747/g.105093 Transcript_31747/m.105093 type:complete len:344 (+) Transcript_31747:449-1480(+)